jgi:hypothetical protein
MKSGLVRILVLTGGVSVLVALVGYVVYPVMVADSEHYIALAQGASTVPRPWGTRVAHPYLARIIARTTGLPLEQAFRVLTLSGLGTFSSGRLPGLSLP